MHFRILNKNLCATRPASLWWVYLCQLPDTHPAALSLRLLKRMGAENKTEKLLGQDKDRD